MIRRPLTATVVTLCAALALTACNGSPEAGRPNPTPTSISTTPTPTTTAPSTPIWTPEQQAAINAAKARYAGARAAVNKALQSPTTATRPALVKAGNGGSWLISILGQIDFQVDNGWYQAGDIQIASVTVRSVNLAAAQPEVHLVACIDSSRVSTRFQEDGKPVPMGPDNGRRHKVQARLVFAPPTGQSTKTWFLVEEKGLGKC
jgi:hypothetical protein